MGPSYLKEIDHPSIVEFIDERFNGITSLMTDTALIYGGAINSVLAGLSIEGDLDIAVSSAEFGMLSQNIASSTMWVQTDGDHVPERAATAGWRPPPKLRARSSKYDEEPTLPLNRIAQFETVNGAIVQVVQAKTATGDPVEDALTIVRAVDLKCCGVAMDKFGRMWEAVEGGYDDCLNRILRMNSYDPLRNAENTKARIQKYLSRGWQLGTSIDTIMDNFRKAQEEHLRQKAAKAARSKKRKKTKLPKGMYVVAGPRGQAAIKVYKRLIERAGLTRLNTTIISLSTKYFSCKMDLNDQLKIKDYFMWYPQKGFTLKLDQAEELALRVLKQLLKEYNIDLYSPAPKKVVAGYSAHSYPPGMKKKKVSPGADARMKAGYDTMYDGGKFTMGTTPEAVPEDAPEPPPMDAEPYIEVTDATDPEPANEDVQEEEISFKTTHKFCYGNPFKNEEGN